MKKFFIVLGMLIGAAVGFVVAMLIINLINSLSTSDPEEEEFENLEATVIYEHEINLDDYDTNIAITEAGEYHLYGKFSHLIKIDTPQVDESVSPKPAVTLFLHDVNFVSESTAIKGNKDSDLVLTSPPKTTNTIASTGDTVVEAAGHVAIDGEGMLTIWNQQTEGRGVAVAANNMAIYSSEVVLIGGNTSTGAGISTKDQYWINGGDVTILGMDMLEPPAFNDARVSELTRRSASFSLKQVYPTGSAIKVLNSKGVKVATYTAPADFRTIVVSNSLIGPGEYTLYIDNTEVKTIEVQ